MTKTNDSSVAQKNRKRKNGSTGGKANPLKGPRDEVRNTNPQRAEKRNPVDISDPN